MRRSSADTVWNTSAIVSDNSLIGRVLHTLLGYTDRPTQLQLLVYIVTLAVIFGLMKLFSPPPKRISGARDELIERQSNVT